MRGIDLDNDAERPALSQAKLAILTKKQVIDTHKHVWVKDAL